MATEEALQREGNWLQQNRAQIVFKELEHILRECCKRLYAKNKIEEKPHISPGSLKGGGNAITEKLVLLPRFGQDNLTAMVSLHGENIIQAEVNLKYAKSAVGGFYRATAIPDVQWKLQQVQDASNQCVKALQILLKGVKKYNEAIASNKFTPEKTQQLIITVLTLIKEHLKQARNSLTMPKKKSLVELCQFQPIKSFNPPLPHDILLSYYIASAKLVCAAYQVVSKVNGVQTVTIYQAECQLQQFVEVIQLLSSAFSIAHDYIANYTMLKSHHIQS